jgi:hypothetical protein
MNATGATAATGVTGLLGGVTDLREGVTNSLKDGKDLPRGVAGLLGGVTDLRGEGTIMVRGAKTETDGLFMMGVPAGLPNTGGKALPGNTGYGRIALSSLPSFKMVSAAHSASPSLSESSSSSSSSSSESSST